MSVTISAATIMSNTAANCSLPAFSTSTNVTAAQALAWLVEGVQSLCALHRQKLGEDLDLLTTTTLSTVADTGGIALPSNFGELHNLIWAKSATEAYEIGPASAGDIDPVNHDPKEWVEAPKYRIEGSSIVLYPTPDRVYSVHAWYTTHTAVATASDAFQGRLDWGLWLEFDLGIKCLRRKRRWTDLASMQEAQNALAAQLFAPARKRDKAGPVRIRDTEGEELEDYARRYW